MAKIDGARFNMGSNGDPDFPLARKSGVRLKCCISANIQDRNKWFAALDSALNVLSKHIQMIKVAYL